MATQKHYFNKPTKKLLVPSGKKVSHARPKCSRGNRINRTVLPPRSSVDVIDLGRPRITPPATAPRTRARVPHTPIPRLYGGAVCARAKRKPSSGAMEAGTRHSASPDDCSDGADATSAPSEFLAEFLSAIMRRQYAEALKFCRLILQYEPDNSTARSFYPLLRHKLHEGSESGGGESLSGSSGAPHSRSSSRSHSCSHSHSHSRSHSHSCSRSRHGARWSEGGSVSSQSSLELDWSGAERAPDDNTDDNGNDTATLARPPTTEDLENDNDVSSFKTQSSSSSLRRLRAQFACSIK